MPASLTKVNGINIAYRVQGKGPPLVLIMGYRLNSTAWPASFIDQLARRFTVIAPDNRGTGLSDKPVEGYALANMARDVGALLDELKIPQVHMLGYSMGGAIAQEFVRQFPDRVMSLILCATMAGGPSAIYAETSVVRVMRDLDGLSPEQAARRIWKVTYAPSYLAQHEALAEDQMRREIATPTPLHAADLQFQAFAEFDGSRALADIRKPTLILTGDLDRLISPQNSRKIAGLIPNAKLIVVPGGGHRVLWEATQECIAHIVEFIGTSNQRRDAQASAIMNENAPKFSKSPVSLVESLLRWPSTLAGTALEALTAVRQSMAVGSSSRFGDGKPIILVPPHLGSDLVLHSLSLWLKALGYRPATVGILCNLGDSSDRRSLMRSIDEITTRLGRRAVLLTHSSSLALALRAAKDRQEKVSDVIIFDAFSRIKHDSSVRTHFISSGLLALEGALELPRLLRSIGIELIEAPTTKSHIPDHSNVRLTS